MKMLASRIERDLQVGEWKQCAVYEDELKRLWPLNEKERETKIAQFAKQYGFRLRFYRKGVCAIFDKWPRSTRRSALAKVKEGTAGALRPRMLAVHVYEVRPRSDKCGVDLISDVLPFGRLRFDEPNAVTNAIDYAKFRSRSHRAVIRVYDDAGNVIETHEHAGDFKAW
jgi:hypothetical protein